MKRCLAGVYCKVGHDGSGARKVSPKCGLVCGWAGCNKLAHTQCAEAMHQHRQDHQPAAPSHWCTHSQQGHTYDVLLLDVARSLGIAGEQLSTEVQQRLQRGMCVALQRDAMQQPLVCLAQMPAAQADQLGTANANLYAMMETNCPDAFCRRVSDQGGPMAIFGIRAVMGNTSRDLHKTNPGWHSYMQDKDLALQVVTIANSECHALQQAGPLFSNALQRLLQWLINAGLASNTAVMPGTYFSGKAVTSAPPWYNSDHIDSGDAVCSAIIWYQLGRGVLLGGQFVLHVAPGLDIEFTPLHGTMLVLDSATVPHYTKPAVLISGDRKQLGTALYTKQSTVKQCVRLWEESLPAGLLKKAIKSNWPDARQILQQHFDT